MATTQAAAVWMMYFELAQQSSATIYTIGIYDNSDMDRNPRRAPEDRESERRACVTFQILSMIWKRCGATLPAGFAASTRSDITPAIPIETDRFEK